jgi:hypothetical protein
MKTTLLIITTLFFLLLIPHNSHAATIGLPLHNAGLVGYWNLNEGHGFTAYDRSGNGFHGTLKTMTNDDWVNGNTGLGKALNFDGASDYIRIGSPSKLDITGDITVSAWVNLDTLSDTSVIVTWANLGYSTYPFHLVVLTDGTLRFNRSGVATDSAASAIPSGSWVHVAVTDDTVNNQSVHYLNGVPIKVQAYTSSAVSGDDVFAIGREDAQFADGDMDEIRIYNRVLSPAEIKRLYNLARPKITSITNTGLVGYWAFEEGQGTKATDSSFNSNHGTLTTMDDSDWVDGRVGKALDFDGSSDYIDVATPNLPTDDFTYSVWVNLDANTDEMIAMASDGAGGNEFFFYINGSSQVQMAVNTTGYTFTSATISVGAWTHIVATRSGTTLTVYVDGVNKGTDTASGTMGFSTCSLLIGADADATCVGSLGNYLDGKIDEFRIYNRALSETEVLALYKGSKRTVINKTKKNRITNGLVGHWTFDGPDIFSTTAIDSSSNGNNGAMTNGPKTVLGKIGQALSFDGSDDRIEISSTFGLGTTNMSVALWVNLDSTSESGAFVKIGGTSPNQGYAIGVGGSTFDNNGNDLILLYEGVRWIDTGDLIGTGWHQVVLTINGSGHPTAYMDGVSTYSDTTGAPTTPSSSVTYIGGYTGSAAENRHGDAKLDEVRIYNRTLTQGEVEALYDMGR